MSNQSTATIVVGVDGSIGSQAALAWAVDEAARRGVTVVAVRAWSIPAIAVPAFGPAMTIPWDRFEESAEEALGQAIAALGPHPRAPIRTKVVEGQAASVLLDVAAGALMLVVGSRGHGGLAELLLGSHQPCLRPPISRSGRDHPVHVGRQPPWMKPRGT
jgi:nucleotide-binding universal stress UspA family protein